MSVVEEKWSHIASLDKDTSGNNYKVTFCIGNAAAVLLRRLSKPNMCWPVPGSFANHSVRLGSHLMPRRLTA